MFWSRTVPDEEQGIPQNDPPVEAPVDAPQQQFMEMRPDAPQKIEEEEEEEKICRICLDDEDPQDMIAPCLCKGSSKWVHRDCLDRWRANEVDRAWSQCTECMFEYRMKPSFQRKNWNRFKFMAFVSRDVLLVTLVLQMIIGLLGGLVALLDGDSGAVHALDKTCAIGGGRWCQLSVYYLCGMFIFFCLLGLIGSFYLCQFDCNAFEAVQTARQQTLEPRSIRSTSERADHYYRRRQLGQERRTRYFCHGCYCDCGGWTVWPGADCGHCCHPAGGGGGCCGGCDPCGSGSDSCGCGESFVLVLIVLAVMAVVFAMIGLIVGAVLVIILLQKILQRHIFVLQKKTLAKSFAVLDLSQQQDLHGTVKVPKPGEFPEVTKETTVTEDPLKPPYVETNDRGRHPVPASPLEHDFLSHEDRTNLEKMGLIAPTSS